MRKQRRKTSCLLHVIEIILISYSLLNQHLQYLDSFYTNSAAKAHGYKCDLSLSQFKLYKTKLSLCLLVLVSSYF